MVLISEIGAFLVCGNFTIRATWHRNFAQSVNMTIYTERTKFTFKSYQSDICDTMIFGQQESEFFHLELSVCKRFSSWINFDCLVFMSVLDKGSRQKKRISYGQADCKG